YTATVRVSDGALEDWETITISVSELNAAPQLDPIGDRVVDEGSLLAFTATASDPDLPAQALSFSLDAGSVGSIDAGTGLFTWTPTEAQGPGVYTATVRVSDGALEDWETITITVSEQQTLARVYFPLIMRNYYPLVGPDLVVERIVVVGSMAQVVIKNEGSALVNDGFWVDLYVDPDPVPTGVNQTWNDGRSAQGIVWAVAGPAAMQALEPGGVLTLTVGDAYYWPPDSRWGSLPPGTPVYAQVDSANALTTFGAVLEPHERAGGAYNNILGPVYSTQASVWATYGFAGRQAYHALTRPFPEGIPPRP
ncbi:MAG: putative Ig domain-containing protein, partial [Thermoflexales bacterium]|nr:putative Ig domain-containing protein [Thermoflexales bacterium]